jgi:putative restriction endonuclease
MNLFVGLTDHDWYKHLCDLGPDEVNFWWPSGKTGFRALEPGEPFLFKAKAPYRAIIGGGFFVKYVAAPVSLAWQAFGEKNGTGGPQEFRERINKYRKDASPDPEIGCTIIAEPFFFPEEIWVDEPPDWASNIVRGKRYSTTHPIGAHLWDQVVERIADPRTIIGPQQAGSSRAAAPETTTGDRFGTPTLIWHRLGQGAFRLSVLDAYGKRCAVSGERVVPVLEAAHIRPYAEEGPHDITNGLALRADIHRLFDLGYVTVDRNLKFHVSSLLDSEYANGKDYYQFQNRDLMILPKRIEDRPALEYLEWHGDVRYRP